MVAVVSMSGVLARILHVAVGLEASGGGRAQRKLETGELTRLALQGSNVDEQQRLAPPCQFKGSCSVPLSDNGLHSLHGRRVVCCTYMYGVRSTAL